MINSTTKAALLIGGIVWFLFSNKAVAQSSSKSLKGEITAEISHQPIIGATILLVQNQQSLKAVSDSMGNFKFNNLPLGRWQLLVSAVGYETKSASEILVTVGKEAVVELELTEKFHSLKEVTVEGASSKNKTNNDLVLVSGRSFNIEDTKRYAGSLGDPSKMAANFAGVVGANDARNDIVIRGNSPIGLLWQLEGLNIPNPNHFGSLGSSGGPVSMLNNNLLDKSDFLTGAFPATYGNALAGVFDLKLRKGNKEKNEFVFQSGFNGIEFGAEGPLSKKKKASYLVNYRYSSLELFKALGMNVGTGTAIPVYQDFSFKVVIPDQHKGVWTFFGLGGNSKVNFMGNDVDTTQTNLYGTENTNTKVKYFTGISGLSYDRLLSEKTRAKFILGLTATDEKYNGDSISVLTRKAFPSGYGSFRTQKLSAIFNLNHKIDYTQSIVSGIQADWNFFNLFLENLYNGGTDKVTTISQKGNTVLVQGFTQWKWRASPFWTIEAGLHAQYLTLNKSFSPEPRASIQYKISNKQSIAIGYGLHAQMQPLPLYFYRNELINQINESNKNLDFTKSNHLVLGYDLLIGKNSRIKIETYYQQLFSVPIQPYNTFYSAINTGNDFGYSYKDSLQNKGTGRNYGVELTLEHFYSKGFYYLFTASLLNSNYKGSDGVERSTAFNNQYASNLLLGKEWQLNKEKDNVLSFNIKMSIAGGKKETPIDYAASVIAGKAVYNDSKAYSITESPYFRTDIKIAWRKNGKHTTQEFAIDLQNVTNHQNIFMNTYNPRTHKTVYEYQQGFFPVPTYRLTF